MCVPRAMVGRWGGGGDGGEGAYGEVVTGWRDRVKSAPIAATAVRTLVAQRP